MKIGSCESVNAFSISDWETMAKKTGLGWPLIRERMEKICRHMLRMLGEVPAQCEKYGESMVTILHDTIENRVAGMLESFSK